jgi:DNA replication protein DnaC
VNSIMDTIGSEIKTRTEQCETHGAYESKCYLGTIWTKCPVCAEEKQRHIEADLAAKAKEAGIRAWAAKVSDAGIPERFRDRSLQSFIAGNEGQAYALKFSETYADQFDDVLATGRSALFIGKPGTGKTHLAAGIGLRIMSRQSRSVLFTTVIRAIRRVKDTWGKSSNETETQAIETLVYPDLLILDEVGVQFGSDTEKMILFDVLNSRYEKRRPTLLLSNLTLDEVKAFLGERVFDRLREDGGEAIVFDWESHRGKPDISGAA